MSGKNGDIPCVCACFYFDQPKKRAWMEDFWRFADRIATESGFLPTHWGYTMQEGSGFEEYQGSFANREEDTERLLQEISKKNPSAIEILSFYNGEAITRDSDSIISIYQKDLDLKYGHLYIQLLPEAFRRIAESTPPFQFFVKRIEEAAPFLDIKYGFVTVMDKGKLPALYFADLNTPNLSLKEFTELNNWALRGEEYQRKIRGVFWGNLISGKHFPDAASKNEILKELKAIYGKNLEEIGGGRIFFASPFDIYDRDRSEIFEAEARTLLDSKEMLL